jgi:cell division protease FtsH
MTSILIVSSVPTAVPTSCSIEAYEVALRHIQDNREAMDRIVEVLVEKETLTGDEFREMLAKYTTIPEENLKAAQEQIKPKVAVAAVAKEL